MSGAKKSPATTSLASGALTTLPQEESPESLRLRLRIGAGKTVGG